MLCFRSSATPGLDFDAINPFFLKPDYAPVLTHGELKAMGVERSEDLCFYVLCVTRHPVGGQHGEPALPRSATILRSELKVATQTN